MNANLDLTPLKTMAILVIINSASTNGRTQERFVKQAKAKPKELPKLVS